MAYFACSKARKTGTDKSTRKSIASGSVSPTFKHRTTGKETLRGVVQLDAISGRNMDYVTSSSLSDRMKSALNINKGSKSSSVRRNNSTSTGQTPAAQLYESNSGIIKTTSIFGLSKKVIIITIGIIIGLYVVVSR